MSDTVLLALIVLVGSVVTGGITLLLARQANNARTEDRKADWKRQDEVADRVEEAAKTLKAATVETNKKLDGVAKDAKASHTFLNSAETKRIRRELRLARALFAVMNELLRRDKAAGVGPNEDAQISLDEINATIADLEGQLKDQLAATKAVEDQQRMKEAIET